MDQAQPVDPPPSELIEVVIVPDPFDDIGSIVTAEANQDWLEESAESEAIRRYHAATEAEQHLRLAGASVQITVASEATSSRQIRLLTRDQALVRAPSVVDHLDYDELGRQGYAITAAGSNIVLSANSATGLIYGTYRLLQELGFAWLDPQEISVPQHLQSLSDIHEIVEYPRQELRGFWIYDSDNLSDEFALWMARNRMNIAAGTTAEQRGRLGIREWGGGHDLLQEVFSDPHLFLTHPEWFGVVNGVRRPVAESGSYFNPAFWNDDMANYFADHLIDRLDTGDLADLDIVNVWPTDSRTNKFDQSAAALSIGNETDNLLHFYAKVALRLEQAWESGILNRQVQLAGISYYLTWLSPSNRDIVESLTGLPYIHVFYLNERSWKGPIATDLANREINRGLVDDFAEWSANSQLSFGHVEYYNYSVFAGLSLTDHQSLAQNSQLVTTADHQISAYMHPLESNPGPRRLTNYLHAIAGWRGKSTETLDQVAERATQAYFEKRYVDHAADWREIYDMTATAVDNATEMFSQNSLTWVLFRDQIWADHALSDAEAVSVIQNYRLGGPQSLVSLPEGFAAAPISASFRGLDESLRMLEDASGRWARILESESDPAIRARMLEDIAWFESTLNRYQLLDAAADLYVARINGEPFAEPAGRVRAAIDALSASPTLRDTLSPVDQTGFLRFYETLMD